MPRARAAACAMRFALPLYALDAPTMMRALCRHDTLLLMAALLAPRRLDARHAYRAAATRARYAASMSMPCLRALMPPRLRRAY